MRTISLFFLIVSLFGCNSNIKIKVDEMKIQQQINNLFLEAPFPPKSYKPVFFSKPDTIYNINLVLKLKIKSEYLLNDSLFTKDWFISVTKEDIFIDWDTSLAKYYVK